VLPPSALFTVDSVPLNLDEYIWHLFDLATAWFIFSIICGLYYKNITIVNDACSHQNEASSGGINYDHHSDNSRGVLYAPRENIYTPVITHDDLNIFIVQATGHTAGQLNSTY
jgi:hypothetical protein